MAEECNEVAVASSFSSRFAPISAYVKNNPAISELSSYTNLITTPLSSYCTGNNIYLLISLKAIIYPMLTISSSINGLIISYSFSLCIT